MTVYTTLNKIRTCEFHMCKVVLERLLPSLGKTAPDNEPLALVSILESIGLADAMFCTSTVFDEHREKVVTFAIRCAEHVLPIFEEAVPNDQRPRLAIQAAKDYLAGKITGDKLEAAAVSARDAADSASDAAESARDAAGFASSKNVADVVLAAARVAGAAEAAADAAAGDAEAAAWAADAAVSAGDAEKQFQENLFREIFGEVQP